MTNDPRGETPSVRRRPTSPTRARSLDAILQVATAVGSTLNLPSVLQAACRAAVDLLGVSHSGALLFERDNRRGVVRAEYPEETGTAGCVIPIAGVPGEEALVAGAPLLVEDTRTPEAEARLGPVIQTLREFDIQSILVVPIISNDRVVGSFSLDSIGCLRRFTPREIELCRAFSALVGTAVENSRLYDDAEHRVRQFEALHAATLALTGAVTLDGVQRAAVDGAVRTLGTRDGGFYQCRPDQTDLVLTHHSQGQRLIGIKLVVGEGLAGLLARGESRHRVVPDYENWDGRAAVFAKRGVGFGAVLAVSVLGQAGPQAILWVEDEVGRHYTEDDINFLCSYADQVAVAMRAVTLQERVKLLGRASREVIGARDLREGLHRLAGIVVQHLEHSYCRLLLLDSTGEHLTAKAAYPIPRKDGMGWQPHLEQPIPLAELPAVRNALEHEAPRLLSSASASDLEALASLSNQLGLPSPLSSVLLVPLRVGGATIGLLDIGELRSMARSRFGADSIELASTIAAESTMLIERLRREEANDRRRYLLARLDEIARNLRGEKGEATLQREIPGLAASLVGYQVAHLYHCHCRLGRLELHGTWLHPELTHAVPDPLLEQAAHLAMTLGEPQTISRSVSTPARPDGTREHLSWRVVAVPLKEAGEVVHVLGVATCSGTVTGDVDRSILERFAVTAAAALQLSRLLDPDQKLAVHLGILHRISDYIQETRDIDTILHVVLTGVTAGYGLGFNRAALFLVDTVCGRREIVGRMGIGHLDEQDARADWDSQSSGTLEDFSRYLHALEQDRIPLTPVGLRVQELRFSPEQDGLLAEVLDRRRPVVSREGRHERFPPEFVEAFRPSGPTAVVPLVARGRALGVLVVDNTFNRALITDDRAEALLTFANTAALAIDTVTLFKEKESALASLRSVEDAAAFAARANVNGNREACLDAIVRATYTGMKCDSVVLFEYDRMREGLRHPPRMMGVKYPDRARRAGQVARESCVYDVLNRDQPEAVESVLQHPRLSKTRFAADEGVASCIALPLRASGREVGVMFVNYRSAREFSDEDLSRATLFGNHAAVAIRYTQLDERAVRQGRLQDAIRDASRALALDLGLGRAALLDRVVRCAVEAVIVHEPDRRALGTLQLLDDSGTRLEFVSTFPAERREALQRLGQGLTVADEEGAAPKGIAVRAFRTRESQRVGDVHRDSAYVEWDRSVRSELAVPLLDGDRVIGVLNVESHLQDAFDPLDQQGLETLAQMAVLAVRRAGAAAV